VVYVEHPVVRRARGHQDKWQERNSERSAKGLMAELSLTCLYSLRVVTKGRWPQVVMPRAGVSCYGGTGRDLIALILCIPSRRVLVTMNRYTSLSR
jgi:hypothetical protein